MNLPPLEELLILFLIIRFIVHKLEEAKIQMAQGGRNARKKNPTSPIIKKVSRVICTSFFIAIFKLR